MRRLRTIRINGKSQLDVKITVEIVSRRSLTRVEQERVVETLTDHLHEACLLDVPYHTVHASDITIR